MVVYGRSFPLSRGGSGALSNKGSRDCNSAFSHGARSIGGRVRRLTTAFRHRLSGAGTRTRRGNRLVRRLRSVPRTSAQGSSRRPSRTRLYRYYNRGEHNAGTSPSSPCYRRYSLNLHRCPFDFLGVFFIIIIVTLIFCDNCMFTKHVNILGSICGTSGCISRGGVSSTIATCRSAISTVRGTNVGNRLICGHRVVTGCHVNCLRSVSSVDNRVGS